MNRTKILWIPALITLLALLGAFVIVATAPSVESRPEERVIPTVRTIAAEPTTPATACAPRVRSSRGPRRT